MEVTSGILTADVMSRELDALPSMLQQLGVVEVEAFFGFGCVGPMDELYKSTLLKPPALLAWVSTEGQRVGFQVSRGDLFVKAMDGKVEVHFCHDSDIHVKGTDAEAVAVFEDRWRSYGFPGYIRRGSEWVSFSQSAP
jgi:hypothetical protein